MDQTQLKQQIALYYSKLPSDAQVVFSNMAWMETLQTISIKYGLSPNQIEILGTETTLILLGIIGTDEYLEAIMDQLGLDSSKTEKLLMEIDDSILSPILPTLEKVYKNHVNSLVSEKYGESDRLDERFSKLPKEVQVAISESNYQQELYTIAGSQKLSIEQMGQLEEVTNKVLLGIIHPDKYEGELKEKLGLSSEKTSEIVNSVNDKVLKNIREILKSHWEGDNNNTPISVDDEVPIPPYAITPTIEIKTPSIIREPLQRLEPAPLSKVETGIYSNAGIEVVTHREIEPEDDVAKSIIASKLSKVTISKPTTSDHSLPKVNSQTVQQMPVKEQPQSKPAHDPYKEVIE